MTTASGAYQSNTFNVPAGGVLHVSITGTFLRCLFASLAAGGAVGFGVGFDGGPSQFLTQGLSVKMAPGASFSEIILDNTGNTSVLTVQLGWGTGDVSDNRLTLTGGGLAITSFPEAQNGTATQVALAAGVAAQLLPANPNRKSANIRNNNAAGGLQMFCDKANTVTVGAGFPIDAGGVLSINHQGPVYGICAGVADVRVWEEA